DAVHVAAYRDRFGHDVPTEHRRPAGVWREERAQDADQRRLPASVGPQDAGHAAGLDCQVQLVQSNLVLPGATPPGRAVFALPATKGLLQTLNFNSCGTHQILLNTEMAKKKDRGGAQLPHGPGWSVFFSFRL